MYLKIGNKVLIGEEELEEDTSLNMNKNNEGTNLDNIKREKNRKIELIKSYWLSLTLNIILSFTDGYYTEDTYYLFIPIFLLFIGILFSAIALRKSKISLEINELNRYIITSCGWMAFFIRLATSNPVYLLILVVPVLTIILNKD